MYKSFVVGSIVFYVATFIFFLQNSVIPSIVTFIAGSAYLYMWYTNDQNARFADWAVTTPLILYVILQKAGVTDEIVWIICLLDVFMIFMGYEGIPKGNDALSDINDKKAWFIAGCVAFAPILYYLLEASKTQNAAVLTLIVWILYPIVYYLKYNKNISDRDSNYALAVMDIVAKVGFGILVSR